MLWANIGTLTNLQTQTNLLRDLAITLLINLLDRTSVQPETALLTYLDDSKGKSALLSWKVIANLNNVLNSMSILLLIFCWFLWYEHNL